ncbi:MAG: hypothetical protein IPO21_03865 [Bacteroidales bacterium]|nr:hypothetical protein [Bacteroidales bacterium]
MSLSLEFSVINHWQGFEPLAGFTAAPTVVENPVGGLSKRHRYIIIFSNYRFGDTRFLIVNCTTCFSTDTPAETHGRASLQGNSSLTWEYKIDCVNSS